MKLVRTDRLAERLTQTVEEIEDERLLNLNFLLRALKQPHPAGEQNRRVDPAADGREQQSQEKSRPHGRSARLLGGRLLMQVLLQIIENVFEPENIFRSRFAEGFVRLQHCASLLLLLPGGGFSGRFTRQLLAFGRRGAVAMNIEKLVKPEPVKQFAA